MRNMGEDKSLLKINTVCDFFSWNIISLMLPRNLFSLSFSFRKMIDQIDILSSYFEIHGRPTIRKFYAER